MKKEFRGLFIFAFQRITVDIKKLFKIKYYKTEDNPSYDKNTSNILSGIYKDLNISSYKASWMSYKERDIKYLKVKKAIIKNTKKKFGKINKIKLNKLDKVGFEKLKKNLSSSKCKTIISKIKNKKVYNAHHVIFSTNHKDKFSRIKKKYINASYDYQDIFSVPELTLAIINEKHIIKVRDYFGCVPTVNTILLSWSFNKYNFDYGTQIFHRDCDDYRQCNLFTLLTDTNNNNGGHEIYLSSHNFLKSKKIIQLKKEKKEKYKLSPETLFNMPIGNITGYGNNDIYDYYFKDQKKELFGSSGSSFLTDAFALHRGVPPQKKPRLILWVSYSLLSEASSSSRNFLGMHKKKTQTKTILKRVKYEKISKIIKCSDLIKYSFRNIIDFSDEK